MPLLSRRRLFPTSPSGTPDNCCVTNDEQSVSSTLETQAFPNSLTPELGIKIHPGCSPVSTPSRKSLTPGLGIRILPGSSSKSVVKRLGGLSITSDYASSPVSRNKASPIQVCNAEESPNRSSPCDLDQQQRVIDILDTSETPSDGKVVIGDFSGTHSLPTTPGYHSDVQYITPQTLESLLTDTNKQGDKNVLIIDCRYPYEFHGGHIQGAVNIYTKETIHEELLSSTSRHRNEQTIVIFHCEFSLERAPNMYRFLREQDRAVHADRYPQLHYPEMYVLHGGYKTFYEQCGTEQCQPKSYRPMLHQQYIDDLKRSQEKTKTADKYMYNPRIGRARMKARVLSLSHG